MTANKWISVCIVGLVLLVGTMMMFKSGRQRSWEKSEKAISGSVSEAGSIYPEETPTINLPAGEDFVRAFSRDEMMQMGFRGLPGPSIGGVMTKSRNFAQDRKFTLWGPVSSPHSWQPLMYFKEN